MIKIICITLITILEIPFLFKMLQAKYDIIRQVAIAIIMILIPLIIFILYKLLLFKF